MMAGRFTFLVEMAHKEEVRPIERLKGALDMLQMREAAYRSAHDLHGDGSMKAGAAWDAMRHAGDKARGLLAKHGGEG